MTSNYDYSSIPDEFLLGEDRGYVGGGGGGGSDSFWSMKAGEMRTVYFTTPGPWTKDLDHGWWSWREIFAEKGLTGVGDLPPGMKAFPVRDQETYRDADDNLRRRDIPPSDPRYDQLLALVIPYTSDRARDKTRATRPVRDVIGVSVVEMDPSGGLYPKVLTMTANRYRKLHEIVNSFRAMNPAGFTLMGYPWVLGFQGETAATELPILRPMPDQPPIDLPDPHDIPELLQQRRAKVYAYVQAATGVDTSAYAKAETPAPAEQAGAAEHAVGEEPGPDGNANGQAAGIGVPADPLAAPPEAAAEPVNRAEVYAAMTDTRLKNLLTKKGVPIRPKTPREELLALALEHSI